MPKFMKLRISNPNGISNLTRIEDVETGNLIAAHSLTLTIVPDGFIKIELVLDPTDVEIDIVGSGEQYVGEKESHLL